MIYSQSHNFNSSYKGNPQIRRKGTALSYTADEIKEFQKCSKNPIYFIMNYVKVVHVDKGLVPFKLYPYQSKLIKHLHKNRFSILKSPRQSGKTVSTIAYILWYSLFNESKTIGILANKQDVARDILGRIKLAFENLPPFLQQGIDGDWNKGKIQFENGSKFLSFATSSDAARNFSFSYLYIDEVAIIEHNVWSEFWKSTYPTISSGKETKVTLVSTPKGLNHYYKLWTESEEGLNSFARFSVKWDDVPGRDQKWKEKTIADMGKDSFEQEYETEFLGSSNTLIKGDTLKQLAMKKSLFSNHGLSVYEKPISDHIYAITVDSARGGGQDYSAFTVIDITEIPYKLVAVYRNNQIPVFRYPDVIYRIAMDYKEAMLLVEINDIGLQVAQLLHQDFEYENMIMTSPQGRSGQQMGSGFSGKSNFGVTMSKGVKRIGCYNLKDLVEDKKLIIHDIDVITELATFSAKGSSYEAEPGTNDDLCMCLVMFAWMVNQKYFKETVNVSIAERIAQDKMKILLDELTPFGFIENGIPKEEVQVDDKGTVWTTNPEEQTEQKQTYWDNWNFV